MRFSTAYTFHVAFHKVHCCTLSIWYAFLYCLHLLRLYPLSSLLHLFCVVCVFIQLTPFTSPSMEFIAVCFFRVVMCARDCLHLLRLYPLSSLLHFFSVVCVFILLTHFTSPSITFTAADHLYGMPLNLLTSFTSLPTEFTAALLLCGMRFYTAYTFHVAYHNFHCCTSSVWYAF